MCDPWEGQDPRVENRCFKVLVESTLKKTALTLLPFLLNPETAPFVLWVNPDLPGSASFFNFSSLSPTPLPKAGSFWFNLPNALPLE